MAGSGSQAAALSCTQHTSIGCCVHASKCKFWCIHRWLQDRECSSESHPLIIVGIRKPSSENSTSKGCARSPGQHQGVLDRVLGCMTPDNRAPQTATPKPKPVQTCSRPPKHDQTADIESDDFRHRNPTLFYATLRLDYAYLRHFPESSHSDHFSRFGKN